jgi:hypothetical protein
MKGKIILTDITTPVEGMVVVWDRADEDHPYEVAYIHEIKKDGIYLSGMYDYHHPFELQSLKQISVDYVSKILPLHPDDYEVAIALIGHELEFKTEAMLIPDAEVPIIDVAKLILPTPVRTIEDIPEDLRESYKQIQVSRNNTVNKYFQERFVVPHDPDIVLAIEDYQKWLDEKGDQKAQ